jgi:hypothetical protein
MRTRTLLLTAALGAAGVASAIAQVYSVNAVGYVNLTAKAGFNLWNNPLDAGADNTVAMLLPGLPEGSIVYTFDGANFKLNTWELGEWSFPNDTLVPGQGFFLRLPPGAADTTVTFVGEVKQGTLSTPLGAGFNLVGSQVPQAGLIQTDLGFTPGEGDVVYKFDTATGNYGLSTFEFETWDPGQPTIGVGEGIWVRKVAAGAWNRTFSVNP